ncbi:MAG: hypothetical protein NTV94_10735 [Planctomycetota bacterium]|nr:hypothetical protein [Planctomycetota bacterium]
MRTSGTTFIDILANAIHELWQWSLTLQLAALIPGRILVAVRD